MCITSTCIFVNVYLLDYVVVILLDKGNLIKRVAAHIHPMRIVNTAGSNHKDCWPTT